MRYALPGVAAAALALLTGCASRCLVETCYRAPDGVLVTAGGKPVTDAGRAKRAEDLEELRKRAAEDDQRQAERRAEESRALQARRAEMVAASAAQLEAQRARMAADEARGYKHVSFADFFLDYKTMPVGSKRAVKGYYRVFGNLETLATVPYGDAWDNFPRVVLLTDSAPREVRTKLLNFTCRQVFCEVLLLGHTARCTVTGVGNPGRSDVCLAVDGMW